MSTEAEEPRLHSHLAVMKQYSRHSVQNWSKTKDLIRSRVSQQYAKCSHFNKKNTLVTVTQKISTLMTKDNRQ
jgi:hypothetical protein